MGYISLYLLYNQHKQQKLKANYICVYHTLNIFTNRSAMPWICTAVGHGKALRRKGQGETQGDRQGRGLCLCLDSNDAWPLFHTLLIVCPAHMHTLEQEWSFLPHVVLSLPSSGSLTIVPLSVTDPLTHTQMHEHARSHTHTRTPECYRLNHECSLTQMFLELKCLDPQRWSNKCSVIPLRSSLQFISFGIPKAVHKWLSMQL